MEKAENPYENDTIMREPRRQISEKIFKSKSAQILQLKRKLKNIDQ